jgi:hypothetical protein
MRQDSIMSNEKDEKPKRRIITLNDSNKPDPMKGFSLLGPDGNRKRDIGRIPELGITEAHRDQLAKRDWTKPKDRDPNNTDDWTTKDCEEKKYSGYRNNSFTGMIELWVAGVIKVQKRAADVENNPHLVATMHEEAFATVGSIVELDVEVKKVPYKHRQQITAPQFGYGKKRK